MARGNLVVFDECGFLDANLMHTYAAFVIVNKGFATGKDRDGNSIDMNRLRCIPIPVANQLFYISSASSTDTEFYTLFRDFSKRMILGDTDYFVACIDCEVVLHPTMHGKEIAPLYDRTIIETAIRTNPEKARREYYCQFTSSAGADAIIRRGTIVRNSEVRKPVLFNDTGKRKIVICYDPARSRDNSVILVGEIYQSPLIGGGIEYKGRLLNCINLLDIGKKRKSPMRTPDQIEYLKELILDYNQGGDDSYSNIIGIYIDAGSGGGGVNIADYLMEDWKGKDGKMHRGLIDKEYSKEYVKKFPNAVDKIHLISPTQYKSIIYEAFIELCNQDKISFTADYDNKGYLTVFEVDEKKVEKLRTSITNKYKNQDISQDELDEILQKEISNLQNVKTRIEKLDWQEEMALQSIDALKEEILSIVRIKRESHKDSFEICTEKRNKLNDDRAYTMALFSYALQEERRKNITVRKPSTVDNRSLLDMLPMKKAKRFSSI